MFGSNARRARDERCETQARQWDGQAAQLRAQIQELQQHRRTDPQAVSYGNRQLGSQLRIAEQNAADLRSLKSR